MNKSSKIKKIVGNGILIAIELVLAIISYELPPIGTVQLNLALIPIVVGSCIYGVATGAILGFTNGLITIFAESTQVFFFAHAPIGTIIVCLAKTMIAGILAALVFKAFVKKNDSSKNEMLASILASITVPIVNTVLFILLGSLFFKEAYIANGFDPSKQSMIGYTIGLVVFTNFLVELGLTIFLSPSICRIIKIVDRKE